MSDRNSTLAEELARANEVLRRRFVHHTGPKGPLTMDQARDLCERMAGPSTWCPVEYADCYLPDCREQRRCVCERR